MAQVQASVPVRRFALIGDSNISRNITRMSRRASPSVKNCQVVHCGVFDVFAASLAKLDSDITVCIVSCLTNFIARCEGPSSVSQRVEPLLQSVVKVLTSVCSSFPERAFMISPPMYRTSPVWYRDGLPEILSSFSQVFNDDKPRNLHLLSSFPTPEFDSDGIHLTSFSGLEFVVSLFDSSDDLLERLGKTASERCDWSAEGTRVLEDRMMVLEQDHRRLNKVVEQKTAVDAELDDFRENERLEDSFVISGLDGLPSSLTGKDWQIKAVEIVQQVIRSLMGREMCIVVVHNITSRQKDAETTYNVKMASIDDSRIIRRKFGSFFHGGADSRPAEFKEISIKNRVTPDTRIRISILKLMAKRYKDSNAGSRVQVIGYDPRPLIKITPPVGASDRRTKVYNYIEACRALPSTFSATDLDPILRRVHPSLRGQIRATFMVLSDDMMRSRRPESAASASAPSESLDLADVAEVDDADELPPSGSNPRRGIRRGASSPPRGPPSHKR